MRITIPITFLVSALLAACHYELKIDIAQANGRVSFTATNGINSCPNNIRVSPEDTPSSPIWYVTNDRPTPCPHRFTYGELPRGWREIVAPEKLTPGTTYIVSIDGGAGVGRESFTVAR